MDKQELAKMFHTYGCLYYLALSPKKGDIYKVRVELGMYESFQAHRWYSCLWSYTQTDSIFYTEHWKPSSLLQATKDLKELGYTLVSKEVYEDSSIIV